MTGRRRSTAGTRRSRYPCDAASPDWSEDDLVIGLEGALTAGGWRWFHVRRSDLCQWQGDPGWPDLFAMHPDRVRPLALECKSQTGVVTGDQLAWGMGLTRADVDWRVVKPADYDALVVELVGDRLLSKTGGRGG